MKRQPAQPRRILPRLPYCANCITRPADRMEDWDGRWFSVCAKCATETVKVYE
jgi:predicted Zn-dependent protease